MPDHSADGLIVVVIVLAIAAVIAWRLAQDRTPPR